LLQNGWMQNCFGLCFWRQNQVRMELDAWKWAMLDLVPSPIIKEFSSWSFSKQDTLRINFQSIIYHDKKKTERVQELFIINKYQRSLKTSRSRMYFPLTHNANLHKIEIWKRLLKQEEILWTLFKNRKSVSMEAPNLRYNQRVSQL
jgi:hypothetical protein